MPANLSSRLLMVPVWPAASNWHWPVYMKCSELGGAEVSYTRRAEGALTATGVVEAEVTERARTAADWEKIVDHYLDPIRLIASIDKPIIARGRLAAMSS